MFHNVEKEVRTNQKNRLNFSQENTDTGIRRDHNMIKWELCPR